MIKKLLLLTALAIGGGVSASAAYPAPRIYVGGKYNSATEISVEGQQCLMSLLRTSLTSTSLSSSYQQYGYYNQIAITGNGNTPYLYYVELNGEGKLYTPTYTSNNNGVQIALNEGSNELSIYYLSLSSISGTGTDAEKFADYKKNYPNKVSLARTVTISASYNQAPPTAKVNGTAIESGATLSLMGGQSYFDFSSTSSGAQYVQFNSTSGNYHYITTSDGSWSQLVKASSKASSQLRLPKCENTEFEIYSLLNTELKTAEADIIATAKRSEPFKFTATVSYQPIKPVITLGVDNPQTADETTTYPLTETESFTTFYADATYNAYNRTHVMVQSSGATHFILTDESGNSQVFAAGGKHRIARGEGVHTVTAYYCGSTYGLTTPEQVIAAAEAEGVAPSEPTSIRLSVDYKPAMPVFYLNQKSYSNVYMYDSYNSTEVASNDGNVYNFVAGQTDGNFFDTDYESKSDYNNSNYFTVTAKGATHFLVEGESFSQLIKAYSEEYNSGFSNRIRLPEGESTLSITAISYYGDNSDADTSEILANCDRSEAFVIKANVEYTPGTPYMTANVEPDDEGLYELNFSNSIVAFLNPQKASQSDLSYNFSGSTYINADNADYFYVEYSNGRKELIRLTGNYNPANYGDTPSTSMWKVKSLTAGSYSMKIYAVNYYYSAIRQSYNTDYAEYLNPTLADVLANGTLSEPLDLKVKVNNRPGDVHVTIGGEEITTGTDNMYELTGSEANAYFCNDDNDYSYYNIIVRSENASGFYVFYEYVSSQSITCGSSYSSTSFPTGKYRVTITPYFNASASSGGDIREGGIAGNTVSFYVRVNPGMTTSGIYAGSATFNDSYTEGYAGASISDYGYYSSSFYLTYAATIGKTENDDLLLSADAANKAGIVLTNNDTEVSLKTITATWSSELTEDNGIVLNIYGKNEPYESVEDLYDTKTQGQLLGTISYGAKTLSLDMDNEYMYIGIRAAKASTNSRAVAENEIAINNIQTEWTISALQTPEYVGYYLPNGDSADFNPEFPTSLTPGMQLKWTNPGAGKITKVLRSKSWKTDYTATSDDIEANTTFENSWVRSADGKTLIFTVPESGAQEFTVAIYSQYEYESGSRNESLGTSLMLAFDSSNSGVSGVDNIAAADEEAEAEYYTLQGVRIAADDLTPGMYIRRQGNNVTKVIVK